MEKEIPLQGGNITSVTRIGETVHRTSGPWSVAVQSLLQYLERRGFNGAPRFLGFDQQGREILSFVEGEVGKYPLQSYMWSDENVVEAAFFLRRYHDATVGYIAPNGATWQFEYPDKSQHEVICHNDVAPYNIVYRNEKPQALIDWDTAGPGPRVWDIAYSLYRFVPLSHAQDMQLLGLTDPAKQAHRLRLFLDAYGLTLPYTEILDVVERRLQALCTFLLEQTANPVYQKLLEDGHLDYYRREIAALQQNRVKLEQCLSKGMYRDA